MNDDACNALFAYGMLLGLAREELSDPVLIQEATALLDAIRLASRRDLGETLLPLVFAPPERDA
jgi:hypothetical protein